MKVYEGTVNNLMNENKMFKQEVNLMKIKLEEKEETCEKAINELKEIYESRISVLKQETVKNS